MHIFDIHLLPRNMVPNKNSLISGPDLLCALMMANGWTERQCETKQILTSVTIHAPSHTVKTPQKASCTQKNTSPTDCDKHVQCSGPGVRLRVGNGQSQSGPSLAERTWANMAAMQPASDNGGQRKGTWSREAGGIYSEGGTIHTHRLSW